MKKIIAFFTNLLDSIENITLKELRQKLRKFKFGNLIFLIILLISVYFTIHHITNFICNNLKQICEQSNSNEWYCVCDDPTISEQLAKLGNSKKAAPWKVTLDHTQTNNQVKIIPKIELANKVYLSIFNINKSSETIIINVNNYEINKDYNFNLAWTVNLTAGPNFFKVIITDQPIDWPTILSNKDIELIESLKRRVKFWTADSLL